MGEGATDWREVASPEELDRLLDGFGGFHDSCLREVHVWTETWMEAQLRYGPGDEAAQTESI